MESSKLYKAPRGTADILPEEQKYWRYVEAKASMISNLYGYQRLDTPVFEDAKLFLRSIGEGTDIVNKEMYIFQDQSKNVLALRPEGTAPVCRAYIEHGMENLSQPVKLYYIASIFRYERPQAGRYRQHHQFGFEAIGEAGAEIDAEVISMAWHYFNDLGLNNLSLHINSIGCKQCRPNYLKALINYYSQHVKNLCNDCQNRYQKNPLRLLDCKQKTCQEIALQTPKSSDYLCKECAEHFSKLTNYLDILNLKYIKNHRLVRGLDYYTRTVFEIQPPDEGSQSALGGGGRYDNLIEQLGGKPTPALGFGSGIERVITNLRKQKISIPDISYPDIFIASIGELAKNYAIKICADLRLKEIPCIMAMGNRSLKSQLRQADSFNVQYVIILGDEEIHKNKAILKNMKSGKQIELPLENLVNNIKSAQLNI